MLGSGMYASRRCGSGKPHELIVGEAYNHFEMSETLASPHGLLGRAVLAQMHLPIAREPRGAQRNRKVPAGQPHFDRGLSDRPLTTTNRCGEPKDCAFPQLEAAAEKSPKAH